MQQFSRTRFGYMFLTYFFWLGLKFVTKVDEIYMDLDVPYIEAFKKLNTDCKFNLQSSQFVESCSQAKSFISRGRFSRALRLAVEKIGVCGSVTCIDLLFGSETYFGYNIATAVFSIAVIYLLMKLSRLISTKRPKIFYHPQLPMQQLTKPEINGVPAQVVDITS